MRRIMAIAVVLLCSTAQAQTLTPVGSIKREPFSNKTEPQPRLYPPAKPPRPRFVPVRFVPVEVERFHD